MLEVRRTNSDDKDFKILVEKLDLDLVLREGQNEQSFYNQFNGIDTIKYVVVAYVKDEPVSCGAIKVFNKDSVEVKRMYTLEEYRGKGLASKVLVELENWAKELLYDKCVLETGRKQLEAISLYQKLGYKLIPNYGQYIGIENSICFEKKIN